MTITLVPAYGRDYKNKKDVLADFNANKDFVIATMMHPDSGRYANKSDLKGTEKSVMIRYDRLMKVIVVKL